MDLISPVTTYSYQVWPSLHGYTNFIVITHLINLLGVNSPTEHIQKLRMIKSPGEIELMRVAGKIASNSFHQV